MNNVQFIKEVLKSLNICFTDPCDASYTGDCAVFGGGGDTITNFTYDTSTSTLTITTDMGSFSAVVEMSPDNVLTTSVIGAYPIGTDLTTILNDLVGDSHPPMVVTNNAAAYNFNAANQTLNVPQSSSIVENPDGTLTFTTGDGSPDVTIGFDDTEVTTDAPYTIGGTTYPAGSPLQDILNALNAPAVTSANGMFDNANQGLTWDVTNFTTATGLTTQNLGGELLIQGPQNFTTNVVTNSSVAVDASISASNEILIQNTNNARQIFIDNTGVEIRGDNTTGQSLKVDDVNINIKNPVPAATGTPIPLARDTNGNLVEAPASSSGNEHLAATDVVAWSDGSDIVAVQTSAGNVEITVPADVTSFTIDLPVEFTGITAPSPTIDVNIAVIWQGTRIFNQSETTMRYPIYSSFWNRDGELFATFDTSDDDGNPQRRVQPFTTAGRMDISYSAVDVAGIFTLKLAF